MGQHSSLTLLDLHALHAWAWANATERGAQEISSADLGKVGWQQSDNTFWLLTSSLPVIWTQLQTGSGINEAGLVHTTGAENINGVKTFLSAPIVPTPSTTSEAATKGYVDSAVNAVSGEYGAPVADAAALRAIASAGIPDRQLRLVEGLGALYRYDTTGTGTDNGDGIITPTDVSGNGRWFKVQAATQDHEGLTGLLGGAAADHQHLTTAQVALLPTAQQQAALAGTAGTPSDTNRFVTDADTRLSGGGGGGVAVVWTWADAAARAAQVVVSGDIGKIGRQVSDNSFWALTAVSPSTWVQVGGSSGAGAATPMVDAQCSASGAQALTANVTPINYDTKAIDSDGAVTTGAAWKFTCPAGKGGKYQVTIAAFLGTAAGLQLFKNGVAVKYLVSGGASTVLSGSMTIDLAAGDYIDVRAAANISTMAMASGNWISITRIPDSANVAGGVPTVMGSCSYNGGDVAVGAGATVLVPFDTKQFDSDLAITVGAGAKFTCPAGKGGKYLFIGAVLVGNQTAGTSNVQIWKNGVFYRYGSQMSYSGGWWPVLPISVIIDLAPGDYVQIYVSNNIMIGAIKGSAAPGSTHLEVCRIADTSGGMMAGASLALVRADCSTAVAQSLSAGTIIDFGTKNLDSDGAVTTGAGWRFTCPVGKGGTYRVSLCILTSAAVGSAQLFKNGSLYRYIISSTSSTVGTGSLDIELAPGDYIDIRSTSAWSLAGGAAANWISISSLATYQTTQVSQGISCKYRAQSAQSIPGTGASTIVNFDTKTWQGGWDTHNAVTTGASWRFTAPISGKYQVSCSLALSGGTVQVVAVWKNGVKDSWFGGPQGGSCGGSSVVHLDAGEYLDLRIENWSGSAKNLDVSLPQNNWIAINYEGP